MYPAVIPESLIVHLHVHVRTRVTSIHFQPLLEVDLARKVVRPCQSMVIMWRVRERVPLPPSQPLCKLPLWGLGYAPEQGRTQDLELGGGALRAEGRKGGRGRRPLPLQLGGMGERCKLPHWGLGRSPRSFATEFRVMKLQNNTEFHTETAFMPSSCANCACARAAAALGLTFV